MNFREIMDRYYFNFPEAFLYGGGIEIAVWFWRDEYKN